MTRKSRNFAAAGGFAALICASLIATLTSQTREPPPTRLAVAPSRPPHLINLPSSASAPARSGSSLASTVTSTPNSPPDWIGMVGRHMPRATVTRLVVARSASETTVSGAFQCFDARGRVVAVLSAANQSLEPANLRLEISKDGAVQQVVPVLIDPGVEKSSTAEISISRKSGSWSVVARDSDGEELARAAFEVKPPRSCSQQRMKGAGS